MQGFFLGLANGITCLATCAPVLVPFLLGEGRRPGQNGRLLLKFLAGRLGGYLVFGLLAWATSQLVLWSPVHKSLVFGPAYAGLALVLLAYGLSGEQGACGGSLKQLSGRLRRFGPALLPAALGFFTGLNLCPPFLMAFAGAAAAGSLFSSLFFFLAFFAGTSLFLLPVSFLGALRNAQALRQVGKLAAVLMALYYFFNGIFLFIGGLSQL